MFCFDEARGSRFAGAGQPNGQKKGGPLHFSSDCLKPLIAVRKPDLGPHTHRALRDSANAAAQRGEYYWDNFRFAALLLVRILIVIAGAYRRFPCTRNLRAGWP